MAIESILPSDSGKVAFEKTGRNFEVLESKVEMMEDCTSGYIADHISIAVNKGIKRGYFMAVNVRDTPENDWGYDIEFRMGETPRVIVFSTRSRTGETYIRELDTNTRAWSYDWRQLATSEQINVLLEYKNMGSVSASNPNSNYKTGLFNVGTPIDGKYFYVTKIKYPDLGDGYYKLIAYGFDASDDKTKDSMWTGRIHAGQFTGWVEQSTTTKTDILSSDMRNGWKQFLSYWVSFDNNGCTVSMNGVITNDSDTQQYVTLMNLPTKLRPPINRYIKLNSSNSTIPTVPVVIKTNGDIETQIAIPKNTQIFLQESYGI